MLMGQAPVSTEDVQHLKSKIRALVEENDRLKKDLKFFQEFGSVKAWVDQLIFKQQYIQQLQKNGECASAAPLASATSSVKMNLPKLAYEDIKPHFQANWSSSPPPPVLNAPETPIEETNKPQKYPSDLYNNPFPITQDILDQIPPGSKKSETRFVGSLLRLMYTDNYLGTHTMSANLTGKKCMDENELLSIIKATLDFFQFKDHEKVKKEGEVRKGISTFLNNTKQKLKKLQNNSSKL
ncbi:BEN domain-containing protein 6-like [Daphnia magna]|nr:BEN domain-containing protein 6-like [Daphnia magna]